MLFKRGVRGGDVKRKEKDETDELDTEEPFKCCIVINLLNKQEIIYHYETKEERDSEFEDLEENGLWVNLGDHLIPKSQILYIEKKDSLN